MGALIAHEAPPWPRHPPQTSCSTPPPTPPRAPDQAGAHVDNDAQLAEVSLKLAAWHHSCNSLGAFFFAWRLASRRVNQARKRRRRRAANRWLRAALGLSVAPRGAWTAVGLSADTGESATSRRRRTARKRNRARKQTRRAGRTRRRKRDGRNAGRPRKLHHRGSRVARKTQEGVGNFADLGTRERGGARDTAFL